MKKKGGTTIKKKKQGSFLREGSELGVELFASRLPLEEGGDEGDEGEAGEDEPLHKVGPGLALRLGGVEDGEVVLDLGGEGDGGVLGGVGAGVLDDAVGLLEGDGASLDGADGVDVGHVVAGEKHGPGHRGGALGGGGEDLGVLVDPVRVTQLHVERGGGAHVEDGHLDGQGRVDHRLRVQNDLVGQQQRALHLPSEARGAAVALSVHGHAQGQQREQNEQGEATSRQHLVCLDLKEKKHRVFTETRASKLVWFKKVGFVLGKSRKSRENYSPRPAHALCIRFNPKLISPSPTRDVSGRLTGLDWKML